MQEGTIVRLVEDRGFGFLRYTNEAGEEADLFFHLNDVQGVSFDDLKVDDKMSFEIGEGKQGPAAKNVQRV